MLMAGERTPDTSPGSGPGSSDDDISLREHMQRQLDTQGRYFERLHAEQGAYFERVISDMWDRLNERFDAQRQAVEELKSTTATHFESVNEQRGQLHDQATTLMPRSEADVRFQSVSERIDSIAVKLAEIELRVQSRLDLAQGRSSGLDKAWGYLVAAISAATAVVSIVVILAVR